MDAYSNKILLIDDDQVFRDSVVCFLEDMGYTVIPADNGLTGLQLLKKNPDIDLALVDLSMPVMDGFAFIANTRDIFPDIPIVVISGVGILEKAIEAIRLGAWDFVNKPIESQELLHIIIERNIERYVAIKAKKEYKVFLENLAKMRSEQLDKVMANQKSAGDAPAGAQGLHAKAFRSSIIPALIIQGDGQMVIDANDAFSSLSGIDRDEMLGRPCRAAGIDVLANSGGTAMTDILVSAGEVEAMCLMRGGKPFPATLRATPLDAAGQIHMLSFDIRGQIG
ncbi:response regulator [Fundidesulfovibrio terrae]|uniref:response regulator n=1 Tax=Fundidesulfovibrio terrae TaxID=2922866 RepID=UPI00311AA6BA